MCALFERTVGEIVNSKIFQSHKEGTMSSLDQALSKLTEAADIGANEEVQAVARVRKDRADITNRARQRGDSAGQLLSGLIGESNAELEAEQNERKRQKQEEADRRRSKAEEEAARKRQEAQAILDEERRLLEEKEQRRLQMVADLEKKRRLEAGEVDEEEEARKRMEAEEEERRIAAEKAREAAEEAALKNSNEALAEQIRAMKLQKEAEEAAEAAAKLKKKRIMTGIAAAAAVLIVSVIVYYFATLKAPDYYKLSDGYQTYSLKLENAPLTAFNEQKLEFNRVEQEEKRVHTGSGGGKKPKDTGFGVSASSILSGNTIVK